MNNGFFSIEKSRDGITFEALTTVNTSTGDAQQHYSFIDRQPYNTGFYRIAQTDRDGQRNYYRTIEVRMKSIKGFTAIQYVQDNDVYIQASGAVPGTGMLELYGTDGKKMTSQRIQLTKEVSIYKINQPLRKGIYLLNILSNGKRLYTSKMMLL